MSDKTAGTNGPLTQQHGDSIPASFDPHLDHTLTEDATIPEFCASWLTILSQIIEGTHCSVVFLPHHEKDQHRPIATWPKKDSIDSRFVDITKRVMQSKKGHALFFGAGNIGKTEEYSACHIAYPFKVPGKTAGVAALELTPRPQEKIHAAMRQLQWGAVLLENRIEQSDNHTVLPHHLNLVFDTLKTALQEQSFHTSATLVATELATKLQCHRVSIGFLKKNQVEVVALSHNAHFDGQMNIIRTIGAAMDESIDQCAAITCLPSTDKKTSVHRAHGELIQAHDSTAIITVPFLHNNDEAYGAITFEWLAEQEPDRNIAEQCQEVATLLGPILEEKRCNDLPIYLKNLESLKKLTSTITVSGHWLAKLTMGCCLVLALFFTFAVGEYRVSAYSTLEGTVQRALIAPFDGYLHEAKNRAGDIVEKGELLASLDTKDLTLQRLQWASQRNQHTLEYHQAVALNQTAKAKIIQELIKQTESQLALLEEQISRSEIQAPLTGLIISGDWSQSIGAPIKRGDILFEIAPVNSYRIMLEVDEKDIAHIQKKQKGTLVLSALPGSSFPFQVMKITPVSTAKEGRNFFLVEAHLMQQSHELRPGMQGYGKIHTGQRKLIWIWTHNLAEHLRLWLWFRIP